MPRRPFPSPAYSHYEVDSEGQLYDCRDGRAVPVGVGEDGRYILRSQRPMRACMVVQPEMLMSLTWGEQLTPPALRPQQEPAPKPKPKSRRRRKSSSQDAKQEKSPPENAREDADEEGVGESEA